MANNGLIKIHGHDNGNVLKLFSQDPSTGRLLWNGAPIAGAGGSSGGSGGDANISSNSTNALKRYSDGLYVKDLTSTINSHVDSTIVNNLYGVHGVRYYNKELQVRQNGAWVTIVSAETEIKISPRINNALIKYSDGYYVPAIPVDNALLGDVAKAKSDLQANIDKLQLDVNNNYTNITNEISKIASNTQKQIVKEYTGNFNVLSEVIDISTLIPNSNIILNFEVLIQNISLSNTLTVDIEEMGIKTMNVELEFNEVQRYKLSNINKIKIYTKGEYKVILYINYI